MVGHGRAPGVEHGGEADAGTEMLRVGGDPRQGRARGPEQQIVDGGLVLEGDGGDLGGQGEDDVEVADREEVGLAGGEPVPRRRTLAAWGSAGYGRNCRRRAGGRTRRSPRHARRGWPCGTARSPPSP